MAQQRLSDHHQRLVLCVRRIDDLCEASFAIDVKVHIGKVTFARDVAGQVTPVGLRIYDVFGCRFVIGEVCRKFLQKLLEHNLGIDKALVR